MSLKEAIRSMAEGLADGTERYGVQTKLIVAIGRESSPKIGEEIAGAAAASGSAVALDLGGTEAVNPPEKFSRAFALARDAGLKATIHAGEGAGSRRQNLANIRTAVAMGAHRIGHAIDLSRDKGLASLVRAKSVAVEMNAISNLVLRKVSNLRDLGIDKLLDEGVLVSLNSDDPALWPDGGLSQVYSSVCEAYGFGKSELDDFAENAYRSAFIGAKEKQRLVQEYRSARSKLF
jgi:adenosine deaminase